jgi:hypothetical protein
MAVEFTAAPLPTVMKQEPKTLREEVEEYFADAPELVAIARCESHFRQFEKDGKVKRGQVNRYDLGIMQINELYHGEKAEELGLDLHTLEGNLKYARYLYDKEDPRRGTPPRSAGKLTRRSQRNKPHSPHRKGRFCVELGRFLLTK